MTDKKPAIPLTDQINEVTAEIANRRATYRHFIATGKMTQDEAEAAIGRMEAVYTTLIWLRTNRAWVLAAKPGDDLIPGPGQ